MFTAASPALPASATASTGYLKPPRVKTDVEDSSVLAERRCEPLEPFNACQAGAKEQNRWDGLYKPELVRMAHSLPSSQFSNGRYQQKVQGSITCSAHEAGRLGWS